jgi:hypothetical protein
MSKDRPRPVIPTPAELEEQRSEKAPGAIRSFVSNLFRVRRGVGEAKEIAKPPTAPSAPSPPLSDPDLRVAPTPPTRPAPATTAEASPTPFAASRPASPTSPSATERSEATTRMVSGTGPPTEATPRAEKRRPIVLPAEVVRRRGERVEKPDDL